MSSAQQPAPPAGRRARVTGCSPPWSPEQASATTLQLLVTAVTYVYLCLYVSRASLAIPLALYSAAVLGVLCCWAYCVGTDPALPGGVPCARMARTQAQTRYCRLCAKSVPGLDHHCAWLNTCVGTRNYFFFVALAGLAVTQHTLGIIFAICTPTAWYDAAAGYSIVWPAVYGAVVGVLGVIGVAAFGSLAGFHAFLLWRGLGTFDWLVERNAEWHAREERRAATAAAEPAAAAAAEEHPQSAPEAALEAMVTAYAAASVAPLPITEFDDVAAGDSSGGGGGGGVETGSAASGAQAGAGAAPAAASGEAVAVAVAAAAGGAVAEGSLSEAELGRRALAEAHSRFVASQPGIGGSLFAAVPATGSLLQAGAAGRFDEYRTTSSTAAEAAASSCAVGVEPAAGAAASAGAEPAAGAAASAGAEPADEAAASIVAADSGGTSAVARPSDGAAPPPAPA